MIRLVSEAIQDRVGVRRITEYRMMPLTLIGESLRSRSLIPTIHCLGAAYRSLTAVQGGVTE